MLISLTYSNTFPSTGRTLEGNIQFNKGLGAICGRNEIGKSFIVPPSSSRSLRRSLTSRWGTGMSMALATVTT
jgi:hypothetical protein